MKQNILYKIIAIATFILMVVSCSDEFVKGTYIASLNNFSLNVESSSLQNIPAAGGAVKTQIVATNAVNWEIENLPSWLTSTITQGAGTQDITFNAESNESFTTSRTHIFNVITTNSDWQLTIPVSVTQQKKSKVISITPSDNSSLTFDAKGGQKTLSITSNVPWTTEIKGDFVHLSQTSAQQDLNIVLSVDAYEEIDVTQNRIASIYFKDLSEGEVVQVLTITQTPLQTSLSTEVINVEFDQNKNSKVFSLGSVAGSYSVTSDSPWLSIVKNQEKGNIDVTVSVDQNDNDDERTSKAYIYLDSSNAIRYTFDVYQKGNKIEINPTTLTTEADGGIYTVNVKTNGRWKSSTQTNWLTLQDNTNSCRIAVSENNSLETRNGVVQFNRINEQNEEVGKTITLMISQEPRHITPDAPILQFDPESSTKTLNVNSDASWTLSTNDTWITLSTSSGIGNGEVNVAVSDNSSSSSRNGTIYLKCLDKTIEIQVVQNTAYLNTDSNPIRFDSKGGTALLGLSTNVSWTVSSSETWLTASPENGEGDKEITLQASQNMTSSQRTAMLSVSSIAGERKINISQDAPSIEVSISSVSFDERGGSEVIVVTTDYDFDVSTSTPWISIERNDNSFSITAKANDVETRSATVIVQILGITGTLKKTISVTQKGDDTPYIDLGLPSGTKWCAYNKGASSIGGNGNIYTGTESQSYKCPTETQTQELVKKCTWTYITIDGITGYKVTGPNGNYIFIPSTPTVSMGGYSMKGMCVWVKGSSDSESQYYLRYSSAYGAMLDMVAHKDESKFTIREVR